MAFGSKAEKKAYRQGLFKGLSQKDKPQSMDSVAVERYAAHMQRKFGLTDSEARKYKADARKEIKKDKQFREDLRCNYIPGYAKLHKK